MKSKLILVCLGCILMIEHGFADESPQKIFSTILDDCKVKNWTECEDKFLDHKRGYFHMVIQNQSAKTAEKEFLSFSQEKYNTSDLRKFTVAPLDLDVEMRVDPEKAFETSKVVEVEKGIYEMHVASDIYYLKNIDGNWFVEVSDVSQKRFENSSEYELSKLLRLYANILNFYRVLGTEFEIDINTFAKLFNQDVVSIVIGLHNEENRKKMMRFLDGVDVQKTARFYWPMTSDEKILSEIKVNKRKWDRTK